jgi:hypothetical protein
LASLDADIDRLRLSSAADVETALAELRAVSSVFSRAVLLGGWSLAYPRATSQLLRVIARDLDSAAEFAPTILAARVLETDDADGVLIAAFPTLTGVLREATADRAGVRRCLGISEPISVQPPEPTWLWPSGKPFPEADTIAGVQARLNYLDLGAGPINGEWTDLTRRAFTRWQVLNGFEPTGELDADTPHELALMTPEAPE